MAQVELLAGLWEGSDLKRKLRKAVSEYPLSMFGPSFKAKLSSGTRGRMVQICQEDSVLRGGEHCDLAIADLVGERISRAAAGQQDASGLDDLAVHLEEQAARIREVMARLALGDRPLSIAGERQLPSPKRPETTPTSTRG